MERKAASSAMNPALIRNRLISWGQELPAPKSQSALSLSLATSLQQTGVCEQWIPHSAHNSDVSSECSSMLHQLGITPTLEMSSSDRFPLTTSTSNSFRFVNTMTEIMDNVVMPKSVQSHIVNMLGLDVDELAVTPSMQRKRSTALQSTHRGREDTNDSFYNNGFSVGTNSISPPLSAGPHFATSPFASKAEHISTDKILHTAQGTTNNLTPCYPFPPSNDQPYDVGATPDDADDQRSGFCRPKSPHSVLRTPDGQMWPRFARGALSPTSSTRKDALHDPLSAGRKGGSDTPPLTPQSGSVKLSIIIEGNEQHPSTVKSTHSNNASHEEMELASWTLQSELLNSLHSGLKSVSSERCEISLVPQCSEPTKLQPLNASGKERTSLDQCEQEQDLIPACHPENPRTSDSRRSHGTNAHQPSHAGAVPEWKALVLMALESDDTLREADDAKSALAQALANAMIGPSHDGVDLPTDELAVRAASR